MKRALSLALVLFCLAAAPTAAAVTISVRPGGWADVVKAPDGFRFVRATATTVVTERVDGSPVWATALPEPILYLRAAVDATGTIEAIAQGNATGAALVISAAGVRSLGGSFGQNATAIAWFPDRGFVYYVQNSPSTYAVFEGASARTVAMAPTSQGFRDIQPDGTVRRGDDFFTAPFNGRQLWEFAQRGDVTVGQCDPAAICMAAAGATFTVLRGDGFEPHLAVDGQTIAIAARSAGGAALAIITPPYPSADVITPPVAIPTPVPTPAPAPVLPAPAQQLPDATVARGIVEDASRGIPRPMTAAQVVATLKAVAARLNASGQPGGPFGVLVKAGGNSCNGYSCDIICAGSGAGQRQWDIFGNADPAESPTPGTQSPGWDGPLSPIAVRDCEVVTSATPIPTSRADTNAGIQRPRRSWTLRRFWRASPISRRIMLAERLLERRRRSLGAPRRASESAARSGSAR
jgi:hypothetical protein